MKVLNLFVLLLCISLGFTACGEDETDESILNEVNNDVNNDGVADDESGSTYNGTMPTMSGEALKFVGKWYGFGPYVASGTSTSRYGLVNGEWEFHNDSTYTWEGHNSYGREYSENGKWRYNEEEKMIITDSPCGFNWQVSDVIDNQWVGTLLSNKTGTFTYIRQDMRVHPDLVRVIDYKNGGFVVVDTIVNFQFNTERFKYGICYGTSSDNDVSSFTKVYANNLYSDFIRDKYGREQYVCDGIYKVEIPNLLANKKYRLCGFLEKSNGEVVYGDVYNALCVIPPQNTIYMGELPDGNGNVRFWANTFVEKEYESNGTTNKYPYNFNRDVNEAITYLSQLGEKWKIPSSDVLSSMFTYSKYGYNKVYEVQGTATGIYSSSASGSVVSKSRINGNQLSLLHLHRGLMSADYIRSPSIIVTYSNSYYGLWWAISNNSVDDGGNVTGVDCYYENLQNSISSYLLPVYETKVIW